MVNTYIGTQSGVYKLDGSGLTLLGLEEYEFQAVYAFADSEDQENDILLAGSYGQGIFRSGDGGATWSPYFDLTYRPAGVPPQSRGRSRRP